MQTRRRRKVGEFGETLVAVNSFQSWQRGGSKYLNSVAWNSEKGRGEEDEERRKKKEKGKKRIKVAINSVSIEEGKFT